MDIEINEVEPTPEEVAIQDAYLDSFYEREVQLVKQLRHAAYTAPDGSDAIRMKIHQGEATEQEWLERIEEINAQYPYPEKP